MANSADGALRSHVSALSDRLAVPGVAVGVAFDGEEHTAFHGVTSVEDPLPVDAGTRFQIGSTGKTYTATAILILVEEGRIDLNAPVRTYVPELRLKDDRVARDVTVLHLLNHTAGWDGDLFEETGEGDDALDLYVRRMATIEQVTPLGATASYNNASFALAGLVLEKATGKPYELVIRDLLLDPLGMRHSSFSAKEIMTHRFSVGHRRSRDGTIAVTRPWNTGRYGVPFGRMLSSNVADQLAWARFHLGDGTASDGTRLLSREQLQMMQQPTASCPGSALGDAVGIGWLLRDVDGTRVVAHGGDTAGQHSIFEMVPERRFAITSLTNCGPNGTEFNEQIMRWAFDVYLGIEVKDPEPVRLEDEALSVYAGRYETIAMIHDVTVADGGLVLVDTIRPEMLVLGEEAPGGAPETLGILPGEGDRFVVTDGSARGERGSFSRSQDGSIDGMHVGGRYATRVR